MRCCRLQKVTLWMPRRAPEAGSKPEQVPSISAASLDFRAAGGQHPRRFPIQNKGGRGHREEMLSFQGGLSVLFSRPQGK